MNIKIKKYLNKTTFITFLFVIISSFLIVNLLRKEDPVIAEAKSLIGKKITVSEVFNVKTGENYSEQISNGKVLLVYLINGCDACKKEIQIINETKKEAISDTKIFGIMFEKTESVNEYIKNQNINFPVLIDKEGKLLKELNLEYFPANFKLQDGVINRTVFGSPKSQADLLELIISK